MTKAAKVQSEKQAQAKLALVRPATATFEATVPLELYEKTKHRLERVGSSLDDFIRMSMRSYLKAQVVYGLKDPIQFGKYRGETVESVIRLDHEIVEWYLNNTQIFKLDAEAQAFLEEIQKLQYNQDLEDDIHGPLGQG